jgi:hypothetical protein
MSPFSGLRVDEWSTNSNDRYYYILNRSLIDDYASVARRREYPFLTMPKESIKRLIKDIPDGNIKANSCTKVSEFQADAQRWIEIWMKEFSIGCLDAPLTQQNLTRMMERMETLNEMVDFCISRNLRPVVIIPPAHKSLCDKFSSTFRENYTYTVINNIKNKRFELLDFLDDQRFQKDEFYKNAYFMNAVGAKIFTKQVLTDLKLSR